MESSRHLRRTQTCLRWCIIAREESHKEPRSCNDGVFVIMRVAVTMRAVEDERICRASCLTLAPD